MKNFTDVKILLLSLYNSVTNDIAHSLKVKKCIYFQIPWLKYFNGLLNHEINENETLIVSVPKFMKNFADLINKTEKR